LQLVDKKRWIRKKINRLINLYIEIRKINQSSIEYLIEAILKNRRWSKVLVILVKNSSVKRILKNNNNKPKK